jgi:hypothetical protein
MQGAHYAVSEKLSNALCAFHQPRVRSQLPKQPEANH